MEFNEYVRHEYLRVMATQQLDKRATELENKTKLLLKQQNIDEVGSFITGLNEEVFVYLATAVTMCAQNIQAEGYMIEKGDYTLKNLYKEMLAKAIAEVEEM